MTNRNVLYLNIGAPVVALGVLGDNLYRAKKEPEGLQINVGPNGLKIQSTASPTSRAYFAFILFLGLTSAAPVAHALGQQVGREQDITDLRLGQRVLVDDGSCPAGQIKEVSGAKMTQTGIARTHKCIPRSGPKQK